ncbi:MAG: DUF3761 domain-containing protein [Solirubrobacteraceae bacterium]
MSATRLTLHLDAGDYTVASATTSIRGTVTRGAKVTINGRRVSVRSGRWNATLHLRLGSNTVAVKATLGGRRSVSKTITVTREKSAAEVERETRAREAQEEAEAHERTASQPTTTTSPPFEEACTNGTYVNSAGKTVCRPEESSSPPAGATAECEDGTYSFSESRSGTCSHHGGVKRWL